MNTMTVASRTPRNPAAAAADLSGWIAALRLWLVLGCLATACFPALRGVDPWFGWLPFWFVVAPALDLAVLRRRQIAARSAALIVRFRQRVRWRRQARPERRHNVRTRRRRSPGNEDARTT